MAVRFGTDGVRGRALTELTPEDAVHLGRAAGRLLGVGRVVIGRDTRRSGPIFEAALAAGLAAEGVDVEFLGVVPTPAVAWLARADDVGGAMVTASHNPWWDNGIKLFAAGGRKLDDHQQAALEQWDGSVPEADLSTPPHAGSITSRADARGRYADAIVDAVGVGTLGGLRVAVDAANGAMGPVAAEVLTRLGAQVDVICDSTAGDDINQNCGATHPELLASHVRATGAHLGLAFDGDGDRVIAIDHTGRVVNGDRLIALSARDRADRGRLPGGLIVVTVMTNLGFHRAMRAHGIEVVTTAVGDRQVMEAMERTGSALGGEQSGHIIHRDLMPSGDGLLAGALIAGVVQREGRPLADLADEVMTPLPQVLLNVRVPAGRAPSVADALAAEAATVEHELGDAGRVVLRASGTEPLVRIMVEADGEARAHELAERLAQQARLLADRPPS